MFGKDKVRFLIRDDAFFQRKSQEPLANRESKQQRCQNQALTDG